MVDTVYLNYYFLLQIYNYFKLFLSDSVYGNLLGGILQHNKQFNIESHVM